MTSGNPSVGASRYSELARRARVPLGYGLGAAFAIFAQPEPASFGRGTSSGTARSGASRLGERLSRKEREARQGRALRLYPESALPGNGVSGHGTGRGRKTWTLGVCFLLLLIFVYRPVMRKEEAFLRRGSARPLPPTPRRFLFSGRVLFRHGGVSVRSTPTEQRFLWSRYKRNREYQAGLGFLAAAIFLAVKLWLR